MTEQQLDRRKFVVYRGKRYAKGNVGHGQVELYEGRKFIRVVSIKSVK